MNKEFCGDEQSQGVSPDRKPGRSVAVIACKRRYDPGEAFQSDWYRHYRKMFTS